MRHSGHDYTQPGAYFVTICVDQGRSAFGQVVDRVMLLNPLGILAQTAWEEFPQRNPDVDVDTYVVMPNHVHVLLWLTQNQESDNRLPSIRSRRFGDDIRGSLSTLIGAYKGSVTRRSHNAGLIPTASLWQRNFYDHVVRSEADAQRIRDYIRNNPVRWMDDQLHPNALSNRFNRAWR
jgi:REP element-mobilizing transposase RayT